MKSLEVVNSIYQEASWDERTCISSCVVSFELNLSEAFSEKVVVL